MEKHGFQRILLATDGSPEADAALSVAASFALAPGARVRVVHVWNLEIHHRHGVWDLEMRSEAEELIGEAVKRLRAGGVDADGEIVRADTNHVAAAVAQSSRQFDADLVVVGSRGLSDWQSIRHHSVSHELLTKVNCPVLIVRGAGTPSLARVRRVLVAVAGGDDIGPATRAAIAAASVPGSKVLVLHVAQAMFSSMGMAYVETEAEMRQTIEEATAAITAARIPVESHIAEPGAVANVVAEAASAWKADLIVVGSARLSDVGSLVFGSVTHGLLQSSDRPLLVAERARA